MNPSQTSVEREMVNMIIVQRAYEANAVPIRTWDEMTGTLVNLTT
jgi:flagellar hook protein FlgE